MTSGGEPRRRVLVVDDEQDIAALIEDWLADQYEVATAFNGRSALQKARSMKPDAVVMDMMMPDMAVHEVLRSLRSDPGTGSVPVLIMTAKNYDEAVAKRVRAEPNARGFINKPFRPGDLKKAVERALMETASAPSLAPPPVAGEIPGDILPGKAADPLPSLKLEPSSVPSWPPRGAPVAPSPVAAPGPFFYTPPPSPPVSSAPPPMEEAPAPVPVAAPTSVEPFPQERRGAKRRGARAPSVDASSAVVRNVSGEDEGKTGFLVFIVRAFRGGLWVGSILAMGGMCVIGTAELTARRFFRVYGEPFLPPVEVSRESDLPYQFDPDSEWSFDGVTYRMNTWRLRGRNVDLQLKPGVTRIMVLGGTASFGVGISSEDLLARRLADELARGGNTYEVMDASHWGYSPDEQWAFYKKIGYSFRPAVVVWVLDEKPEGFPSSEGLRSLSVDRFFHDKFLSRSRFLRVIFHERLKKPSLPGTDPAVLIREAGDFLKDHDTRLMVVPFPPVSGRTWRDPHVAVPEGEDLRMDWKDLTPAGHRRLARFVAEQVVSIR
jgi:CheY-like chemotaxis protein